MTTMQPHFSPLDYSRTSQMCRVPRHADLVDILPKLVCACLESLLFMESCVGADRCQWMLDDAVELARREDYMQRKPSPWQVEEVVPLLVYACIKARQFCEDYEDPLVSRPTWTLDRALALTYEAHIHCWMEIDKELFDE